MNKMRMASELGASGAAPPHAGVYWLRGSGRVGDPDEAPLSLVPVERLKWMLKETMGSPKAFEHRRWELQRELLELGRSCDVSDEDVVESYRQSCHPITGEMSRYLSKAHLAIRLGEVLFIHGALPLTNEVLESRTHPCIWDDFTFAMPWLDKNITAKDVNVETTDDWLAAMDDFVQSSLQAWRENASGDTIWATTGGYNVTDHRYSNLVQYGMGWLPTGERNPTVVYSSWATDGMPRKFFPRANSTDKLFAEFTGEFFRRSRIRLICCGHQPQGDMPNTIRVDIPGSRQPGYIVSCDTSYSGDTHWYNDETVQVTLRSNPGRKSARSGRGLQAYSEVLILQCTHTGKLLDVHCRGCLSDGDEYETSSLDLNGDEKEGNTEQGFVVGKLAEGPQVPSLSVSPHKGPWWTKAAFKDGTYLLAGGKGFDFWNFLVKS
jgi:hypothetical protein